MVVASAGPRLFGLMHRIAYSALLALIVFVGAVLPYRMPVAELPALDRVWLGVIRILDLPVALVGLLGIPYVAGLDLWFGRGVGEFMTAREMLVWHLRVAIPVYVVISYLPVLVITAIKWRTHRHAGDHQDEVGGTPVA